LIKSLIKTNGIRRREFLIRVEASKGSVLNLQEWPRKFYGKRVVEHTGREY
jgi:hypothetical protein